MHYYITTDLGDVINKIMTAGVIVVILIIAFLLYLYWKPAANNLSHLSSKSLPSISSAISQSFSGGINPNETVYILKNKNDSIEVINSKDNSVIENISLEQITPNNMAINSRTDSIYITGSYYNYHNPQYHGMILILNATNGNTIGTIQLQSIPNEISVNPSGTYAYTINSNGTVSELDLKNNDVINVLTFIPNNETNYITFSKSGAEIFTIGNYNYTYNWTICSEAKVSGTYPNGTTYSYTTNSSSVLDSPIPYPGASCVGYKSNPIQYNLPTIYSINVSNNQLFSQTKLVSSPNATCVIDDSTGVELPYSCSNYNFTTTVASTQKQLLISPDGTMLYVLAPISSVKALLGGGNSYQLSLYVMDTSSLGLINKVNIGGGTAGMSLSPTGDYIYAIGAVENDPYAKVQVINTATDSIVDNLSKVNYSGAYDVAVAYNSTYITTSENLVIVNRSNDTISRQLSLIGCPCEIEFGQE